MRPEEQSAEERLETRRLALVPLVPDHASALFALMNEWEVVRMLAVVPWPLTLGDVERHAARQFSTGAESIDFAILEGGKAIGVCGVKRPGGGDPPRIMPRLGYWIGRPYWNRGYATEALAALVGYSFRTFPQDVMGAGVFHGNPGSRRVLEKLGFARAGGYDTYCRSRDAMVATDDMHLARAVWERGKR